MVQSTRRSSSSFPHLASVEGNNWESTLDGDVLGGFLWKTRRDALRSFMVVGFEH
jgi:hypothetical protein